MVNNWILHVKQYAIENNVSYKEALKQSKDAYQHGGSLSGNDLKRLLASTYEKKNEDIGDFKVDKDLSGRRSKVYHNEETNQTVHAIRGTKNLKDWMNDAGMVVGYEGGNRFKHAKKVQKEVEKKYRTDNLTTTGHSLGARLGEKYGSNGKEIITLNRPIIPKTFFKTIPENQFDIRTTLDPVSSLHSLQNNKNLTTISSKTLNPLKEHQINILNRKRNTIFGRE